MFKKDDEVQKIHARDVQAGDVLLCKLDVTKSCVDYKAMLLLFLGELAWNNWDIQKVNLRKHDALIDFAIALFDQNRYFHAAYCSATDNWRDLNTNVGDKYKACIIEENLDHGIMASPLEDYEGYPTVVFRYQNKDKVPVGPQGLSSQPLDEAAKAIFKRIDGREYSFPNAALLVALCINRMAQRPAVDQLEKLILEKWGSEYEDQIKAFFEQFGGKIGEWMDSISEEILVKYWDEKAMVCSQFVAAVFNEAGYIVEQPSHLKKPGDMTLPCVMNGAGALNKSLKDNKFSSLQEAFEAMPLPEPREDLRSFADIANAMRINDMYTPADFAGSDNMVPMGELVFED